MDDGSLWMCKQMVFIHISVHTSYGCAIHSLHPYYTHFKCTLCACMCIWQLSARWVNPPILMTDFQHFQFFMNGNNINNSNEKESFVKCAKLFSWWNDLLNWLSSLEGLIWCAGSITQIVILIGHTEMLQGRLTTLLKEDWYQKEFKMKYIFIHDR